MELGDEGVIERDLTACGSSYRHLCRHLNPPAGVDLWFQNRKSGDPLAATPRFRGGYTGTG
jgi:hypothetical protein